MKVVHSVLGWFTRQVVQDVPAGDALCEFDCRKLQCHVGEWESCERRLQNAAGELMPSQKLAAEQTPERSTGIDRGRV